MDMFDNEAMYCFVLQILDKYGPDAANRMVLALGLGGLFDNRLPFTPPADAGTTEERE